MNTSIYSFSYGNIVVACHFQSPYQAELVRSLWQKLFVCIPTSSPATISFHFDDVPQPTPTASTAVYQSSNLTIWQTEKGFILECGASTIKVITLLSRAVVHLDDLFWSCPLQDQQEFFLLSLLMLLHQHKQYGLHANGIGWQNKEFLVVGHSGSGKTTLTLTLAHQGWTFLGDDALLLRETPSGIIGQAFRRGFACTEQTINHFPGLETTSEEIIPFNEKKWQVNLEVIYPDQFRTNCSPKILLFPEIVEDTTSQLIPIDKARAFFLLMQQSAGIMTDAHIAQQQMQVLKQLVTQARSYRLLLGANVFQESANVSSMLADV